MYDPLPLCIRTTPYYPALSLAIHDLCSACSQCSWIFPDHCRFHTVPWLSMKICCGLETCLLLICVCYCLPQFGHRWRRKTKHNRVQPHLVALGLRRCHKFPCDIMQRPAACHDSWRSSCLFAAASTSKPMGNAAGHHDVLSCIVTHFFYYSMHVSFFPLTLTLLLSQIIVPCSTCLPWCYSVLANAIARWHDYCWLHRSAFHCCFHTLQQYSFKSSHVLVRFLVVGSPLHMFQEFLRGLHESSGVTYMGVVFLSRSLNVPPVMHYPVLPLQVCVFQTIRFDLCHFLKELEASLCIFILLDTLRRASLVNPTTRWSRPMWFSVCTPSLAFLGFYILRS